MLEKFQKFNQNTWNERCSNIHLINEDNFVICIRKIVSISFPNNDLQDFSVQTVFSILNIVETHLVVKGCIVHSIIQKWGENDAQSLKLWKN